MGAEGPIFAAVVGNLADQTIHLGAFGGIAFPVALMVEGPIIMLLAASTALCGDLDSYRKVKRFMWVSAAALTAIHVAIAFTPLYDLLADRIMGLPKELHDPGRLGLQILTPWTAAIAYRRFTQGVLIRFNQSRMVMLGTFVRLITMIVMLAVGGWVLRLPGIATGTLAMSCAVLTEAWFAGWAARPIVRERLPAMPAPANPVTRRSFLIFYIPLAMTPLITLMLQPAGAAAMARMPMAELSLAAWPAVHGLVFLLRSTGFAYNEVVVSMLGRPGARPALRRFALILGATTSGILALLALTPLASIWFREISGFGPELEHVCATALLFAMLMPAYQAMQSWFQGQLVHSRKTRGITEAVALYAVLATSGLLIATAGVHIGDTQIIAKASWPGIYAAIMAFTVAGVSQTLWLARRARTCG
jgi:hypothetical protein